MSFLVRKKQNLLDGATGLERKESTLRSRGETQSNRKELSIRDIGEKYREGEIGAITRTAITASFSQT